MVLWPRGVSADFVRVP